ncbi:hypothetical protein LV89_03223 [Arcicella aurantiaca]|jgi:hypothetical protein|uniref:Uncharacterized protein n=1 Tax=Arcicella aurantiaca TaxID=591202 RepID=A0A316DX42_9BACT|nr:hypothetical protein [Arcicella aurantiaca]PWK22957.1 hypothetical protein LV89_03223 [Arcicella aurantiaca]
MIEITVSPNDRPSSKRAIAFAKELMAIKLQTQKEMRDSFRTDDRIKKIVKDLLDKNDK